MTIDKRRAKRLPVDIPVTVYFFDTMGKSRIGPPLAGGVRDLSPIGAALTVPTIQHNGKHLFYTCNDNPDIVLELAFELSASPEIIIAVPAAPVWFDRDLQSDDKQFNVGLKFLADPRSLEIKTLCKEACKDETIFFTLWNKFF